MRGLLAAVSQSNVEASNSKGLDFTLLEKKVAMLGKKSFSDFYGGKRNRLMTKIGFLWQSCNFEKKFDLSVWVCWYFTVSWLQQIKVQLRFEIMAHDLIMFRQKVTILRNWSFYDGNLHFRTQSCDPVKCAILQQKIKLLFLGRQL